MTTPERLRRRQLVEGGLIIVIGLAMLFQTWWFNAEDRAQRDCIQSNFTALAGALDVRAALTDRETAAAERLNTAELRVASDAGYVRELHRYHDEIEAIKAEREKTPMPPFPPGKCS